MQSTSFNRLTVPNSREGSASYEPPACRWLRGRVPFLRASLTRKRFPWGELSTQGGRAGSQPGEKTLIDKAPKYTFSSDRPWPWVSFDDPVWPLEPWEVMDDEDLADAAVRFAIFYLSGSVQNMTMLRATALVEEAVKRVTADVVAEARTQRYSWGRIAAAFSVGRTAVQKRFGRWPTLERTKALEDQYDRMCWYLESATKNPGEYEYEEEARATRSRCVRRRRGHPIDPLDGFHKTVPPPAGGQ